MYLRSASSPLLSTYQPSNLPTQSQFRPRKTQGVGNSYFPLIMVSVAYALQNSLIVSAILALAQILCYFLLRRSHKAIYELAVGFLCGMSAIGQFATESAPRIESLAIIAMIAVQASTRSNLSTFITFAIQSFIISSRHHTLKTGIKNYSFLYERDIQHSIGLLFLAFIILIFGFSRNCASEVVPNCSSLLEGQAVIPLERENSYLRTRLDSLEDFILTSFHEFKNPTNVILGNLKSLMNDEQHSNPKVQQNVRKALVSCEYLRNMLMNVLDAKKSNHRDLEVSLKDTDTNAFIYKVWSICGGLIKNKNLKGFLRASKNLPKTLYIDEQRLIQVLINLTTNAVKFTKKGSVCIDIQWVPTSYSANRSIFSNLPTETFSEKAEGESIQVYSSEKPKLISNRLDYYELNSTKENLGPGESFSGREYLQASRGVIVIKVTDTGCGMNPSQLNSLFSKFTQVNEDEGLTKIGSGLGLWISKQLVEKLKGEVKIKSMPNLGSTFEIKIPSTVPVPVPIPSIETFILHKGSFFNSFPELQLKNNLKRSYSKKVLIVDDDLFNVELLKEWCENRGYETLEASNGQEALSVIESRSSEIGVILMDENMPVLCGKEAIRKINRFLRDERLGRIPSFCLSGDIGSSFEMQCKEAGFDQVLQKPVDFEILYNLLNQCMRSHVSAILP